MNAKIMNTILCSGIVRIMACIPYIAKINPENKKVSLAKYSTHPLVFFLMSHLTFSA
jgi:hypothetical protein